LINKREALIDALLSELGEEDQQICRRIIEDLNEFGYTPHKENVKGLVLSFKNSGVRQTIAKIGIRVGRNRGVFYSLKFYACENPPEKFADAVRNAVLRSKGQYPCTDCGVCHVREGERGYRCRLPDGTEFVRCGAYVVEIPDLTLGDIDGFNRLLQEQHHYFQTHER